MNRPVWRSLVAAKSDDSFKADLPRQVAAQVRCKGAGSLSRPVTPIVAPRQVVQRAG